MLKNYLKITWAVLKRRKFFTFISLFGISFTLTVLIVVVAFLDHLFAPNYPELQREKILYVPKAELKDTIIGWTNNGPLSFHFIKEYVLKMKTPEGLASLEKESAWQRKQVNLDNTSSTPSTDSQVSRYTLGENNEIRPNNSFLHDNVD